VISRNSVFRTLARPCALRDFELAVERPEAGIAVATFATRTKSPPLPPLARAPGPSGFGLPPYFPKSRDSRSRIVQFDRVDW